MPDDSFIPTLGESHEDVLKTPAEKAEYLVAFSLINPGFTSENLEISMLSLSTILAEYSNDIDSAATEYERQLQEAIDISCPDSNYAVSIVKIEDTDIETTLSIMILDANGEVILKTDKVSKRLDL